MVEFKDMPLLPGATSGRTPQVVESEKLNTIGINGSAFTIRKGDVIKFFDDEPLVVSQKVNTSENSPLAYYVAVERNGENSWLGIGILTRRDINGKPLGSFQEEMLSKPSFKEIYNSLRGKTIKGGNYVPHDFAVFRDGQRVEGEKITREIAEINYV